MPKKKIKDLTDEEMQKICNNQSNCCRGCPLRNQDYDSCMLEVADYLRTTGNKEIEVEE